MSDYNNVPTAPFRLKSTSAETRNLSQLDASTGNLYEAVAIIAKRANQISAALKDEINGKLAEFQATTDTLEEVFENREQIELSKQYERMAKPSLLALEEFANGQVYYRRPEIESDDDTATT